MDDLARIHTKSISEKPELMDGRTKGGSSADKVKQS